MSSNTRQSDGALNADELRAWRGVIETTALLRHRLDTMLMAESGLSGSDYPVLVALHEADLPHLRASELADRIGWERSRLSHQLGRMERRGLVSRSTDEQDSRGSNVCLTRQGRECYLGATKAHSAAVKAHFVSPLSTVQIRQLGDIMQTLAESMGDS